VTRVVASSDAACGVTNAGAATFEVVGNGSLSDEAITSLAILLLDTIGTASSNEGPSKGGNQS
jgi:hypothetical protein